VNRLRAALPDSKPHPSIDTQMAIQLLERHADPKVLADTLSRAAADLEERLGKDRTKWTWGRLHRIEFRHPLGQTAWNRGPIARPGDSYTVNATSGSDYQQTNGASYRQILDVADWDRSVMTNVPGESGDPESPHYDDLLQDWAAGRYHPMPFSRKTVEEATVERIALAPAGK
jgi:penicillin amidase